jgi:hypothetical protein
MALGSAWEGRLCRAHPDVCRFRCNRTAHFEVPIWMQFVIILAQSLAGSWLFDLRNTRRIIMLDALGVAMFHLAGQC